MKSSIEIFSKLATLIRRVLNNFLTPLADLTNLTILPILKIRIILIRDGLIGNLLKKLSTIIPMHFYIFYIHLFWEIFNISISKIKSFLISDNFPILWPFEYYGFPRYSIKFGKFSYNTSSSRMCSNAEKENEVVYE